MRAIVRNSILSAVVFFLFILPLSLSASGKTEGPAAKANIKVAFVYHATVGDYGWFWSHDKARKIADEQLDFVETKALENVTPGATAERVLKELCEDGYKAIVMASQDFEADVKKVAAEYPGTAFLICAGSFSREPNIESFYPKTTQDTYLLGQVAGMMTKTNILGVVGSVISSLDLNIHNAWVLGARSVNPKVQVHMVFLNTYFDPAAEKLAAESLIDAGADVLIQSTNTAAHVQVAEEAKVYSMSHYEDMRQFGKNSYLTGEIFVWEKYYIPTFTAIYEGTWKARRYQPDLKTGIADLAAYGPMVTEDIKKVVEQSKKKMLTEDPEFFWSGPITSNKGKLMVPAGKRLTDEQLMNMDWFVEGAVTAN